ncbi:MAG: phosphoribosylformylglycinamidine synthase [Eubacteriales bacterium]
MSGVKRIYVEKREGFDIEADAFFADLKENLGISGLKKVRILNRYDIEGLEEEDFERTLNTVFSEPAVDAVYKETFETKIGDIYFGVEYLPGQYDQRADSAAQCVQLLTLKERPIVKTAKIFVLSGKVRDEELEKIKKYAINPVDSMLSSFEKPNTLSMELEVPTGVETIDEFISFSEDELEKFRLDMGFAMSHADILFVQDYFKSEKRAPTITELRVIDTYWSDHCRHTTFLTRIKDVEFEDSKMAARVKKAYEEYLESRKFVYGDRKKDINLMDLATIYTKEAKKKGLLSGLDESDEINACTIKEKVSVDNRQEDYLILFKNETHNHPTEIEPFGGAATCLGGAIRDPLSGRAYVYQAMRVTGAGDPLQSVADTLEAKLPQKKITQGAALGYSSYGNQIGLATGLVDEIYHPGYIAKRMEIGAVIAAAPAKNVIRKQPRPGDIILLLGGRTGRDGCGGATGSSKAHNKKSIVTCGAEVQKGNPLIERKLQRLFRDEEFSRLVLRCNDFGAGGVCVAIGELAPGLEVNLNAVPKKYEGLSGTELAISESQERMAVVISPENVDKALDKAKEENLEATVVAEVTDDKRMKLFFNGKAIVDISREFLDSNGATQVSEAYVGNLKEDVFAEKETGNLGSILKSLLNDLNICSKKGLSERFDSTIGASSVLMPFGGKHQATPTQSMAAKVPVEEGDSKTATIMAYGFDPYLCEANEFLGAVYSIVLSVAKSVASGGNIDKMWLTLQEYFQTMGTDPKHWGKPLTALLGAYTAQKGLKVAAIGGKDSMSGSFINMHVPSTLVSFSVCAQDADTIISNEFKKPGSNIYLLSIERDGFGLPEFEDVRKKYAILSEYIKDKKILSAYAVERGGILAAVSKMAFGNKIGVSIDNGIAKEKLLSKSYGDIIIESDEELPEFEKIGNTVKEFTLSAINEKADLNEAYIAFSTKLDPIFPHKAAFKEEKNIKIPLYKKRSKTTRQAAFARPRVIIPVFPGTNCEYDTAAAFKRVGADAHVLVIKNLTPQDIEESIIKLKDEISKSQIVMIPGGFSGGDEPDGSGKFITAVFRNPSISDAINDLMEVRDGLMLGICNGFQALIKLGLVPYGKIVNMREDSPTLTYNTIGRHVSSIINTKVVSVKSPWLLNAQIGEIHSVAVSHGEGRFVATEKEIAKLIKNGQVATQYVDLNGNPTMESPYNPNGSFYAIEGITSPDGRILGKMAHSERSTENTYKNIFGNQNQKIFESGVKYFK